MSNIIHVKIYRGEDWHSEYDVKIEENTSPEDVYNIIKTGYGILDKYKSVRLAWECDINKTISENFKQNENTQGFLLFII